MSFGMVRHGGQVCPECSASTPESLLDEPYLPGTIDRLRKERLEALLVCSICGSDAIDEDGICHGCGGRVGL